MNALCTSAPGKLFLCGEYAVLSGAPAVITTVNRRAQATLTNQNFPKSPITRAVLNHTRRFLEQRSGAPMGAMPRIETRSRGFNNKNTKLGIGSSAAVTASVCGLIFEWAGLPIEDYRGDILQTSLDAHRDLQDGKGSGADVATSVLGGTISFQPDRAPIPLPPPAVHTVFVWTGSAASTVKLIDQIHRLNDRDPVTFNRQIDRLTALAEQMSEAFQNGVSKDIILLAGEYGSAMNALGEAANAPIVTPELARAHTLAMECNGAAKPSGAGGGDAAVAFFPSVEDANDYQTLLAEQSLSILELSTHVTGLCASSCDPSADVRD